MEEGLSLGHVAKFYQTIDQRFLGNQEFVERIERKAEEKEESVAVTSKELGLRLRREGSMISRLYTTYAEQRDPRVEARILRLLTNKSITRSDPSGRPSQFK